MTYPATGPKTTARPIRPTDADAMILRLFRRRFHHVTIHTLYGAIVAQARRPEFYEEFGAADTVEGRRAAGQLDAADGPQFLRSGLVFPDSRAILARDADSTQIDGTADKRLR
jgi:hypothetical protein